MLDDARPQVPKKTNKPAVGNGSVALYARVGRHFCLTFRSGVEVSTLLNGLSDCHELLQDEPLWGPDWIAIGYDQKAVELAVQKSPETPEVARKLLLSDIFAAIWSGLFTGAINGRELVTSPSPPHMAPEVDLGVLLHRQAQW